MVVEKVALLGTVFTWDPRWTSSVVAAYNNGMANNVLILLKLCNQLDYFSILEALERLNIYNVTNLLAESKSPEQKLKISVKKQQREDKNAAEKAALQSLIQSKALEKGRTLNAKELAILALLPIDEAPVDDLTHTSKKSKPSSLSAACEDEDEDEDDEDDVRMGAPLASDLDPALVAAYVANDDLRKENDASLTLLNEMSERLFRRDQKVEYRANQYKECKKLLNCANEELVQAGQNPVYFESTQEWPESQAECNAELGAEES